MAEQQGVPDLGQLKGVPDAVRRRALANAEMSNGLRCYGCGQRIEEGIHAWQLHAKHGPNGVMVERRRVSACGRPECDYALDVMGDATYVEAVSYTWYADDPGPPDSR